MDLTKEEQARLMELKAKVKSQEEQVEFDALEVKKNEDWVKTPPKE